MGHSAGAPACLKLRQLLAKDHWGVGSNVHCIEAAICIAGVLNGSTLTYYFDYDPVSGLPTGNKSWLIDALVTLDTGLSEFLRNRLLVIFLPQFVRDWVWQFGPHIERWIDVDGFVDCQHYLAYDLTLAAYRAANEQLTTHPNTYYLSLDMSFGLSVAPRFRHSILHGVYAMMQRRCKTSHGVNAARKRVP